MCLCFFLVSKIWQTLSVELQRDVYYTCDKFCYLYFHFHDWMCLLHVVSVIKAALYHRSHHIVQLEGVCGGVGGGGTTVNSTRLLENTFSFEPVCVRACVRVCVMQTKRRSWQHFHITFLFIEPRWIHETIWQILQTRLSAANQSVLHVDTSINIQIT